MVAQLVSVQIPQDDSRPGLPGALEELGRVVERHFEGNINFLASHVELGRAAFVIETASKDWKKCASVETVEALAKELVSPKHASVINEANPTPAPKAEKKPAKVKAPKAEAKPAPLPTPEVFEPEVRFTPGLVLEKDGIKHVVCPGKFGKCLRLVPVNEARVAVVIFTVMRAIGVRRLEDINVDNLLPKSFCPECAKIILPTGSQTVLETLAGIEKVFADRKKYEDEVKAAKEAKEAEEEALRIARQDNRTWDELLRDGNMLACGLGLVRPPRFVQGKTIAGVSKDEYIQLGRAAFKIRNSGITAKDVRTIKGWTVQGVIRMAEQRLTSMLS